MYGTLAYNALFPSDMYLCFGFGTLSFVFQACHRCIRFLSLGIEETVGKKSHEKCSQFQHFEDLSILAIL
jgi:hypothetical protein